MKTTYTRDFLRGYAEMKRREEEQRRREMVDVAIDQVSTLVLQAALAGKTEWELVFPTRYSPKPLAQEARYLVNAGYEMEEIRDGLRRKFPDCDVGITEDWVETRPGVREREIHVVLSWK